ncbi:hypothetical protein [Paenibacillus sp. Y412MC10]|uniref:hypothetical protein n=1 Tax=Geobacillus sp. (strain Y412MC10) TaxID=481743 RepID=UPI0011A55627|nr:hypothetical protein [Paenibacillus sp. Y412MC10]
MIIRSSLNPKTKITFIILIIFLFINIIPSQTAQIIILGGTSFITILLNLNQKIDKFSLIFIHYLLLSISILVSNSSISIYYFLSELKILLLFIIPTLFFNIFKKTNPKIVMQYFFQIIIFLVLMVALYGLITTGKLRYTGFLQYSIYISVCLSLLLSYLYDNIKLFWKILIFIDILFLGSSSGVLVFFLTILFKMKTSVWKKIFPLIIGGGISYWYAVVFRGRSIFNGGFLEIDRVQIFNAIIYYTKNNFTFMNYLFGFGIGHELDKFSFVGDNSSIKIAGFIGWFDKFTQNGVYSYAFHNEFLRLFYNFGFVGTFIILLYLYNRLPISTFVILLVAFLTNTVIYSSVGMLVTSMIIGAVQAENSQKSTEIIERKKLNYSRYQRLT